MSRYDVLLFLHVLAATGLLGLAFAFWALILATRPGRPLLAGRAAGTIGQPLGIGIAVSSGLVLLLGVVLAIDIEAYHPWDGWILASIVLWAVGGAAGQRGGISLARAGMGGEDAAADRRRGILLHAVGTIATLAILWLMIAKPGA